MQLITHRNPTISFIWYLVKKTLTRNWTKVHSTFFWLCISDLISSTRSKWRGAEFSSWLKNGFIWFILTEKIGEIKINKERKKECLSYSLVKMKVIDICNHSNWITTMSSQAFFSPLFPWRPNETKNQTWRQNWSAISRTIGWRDL